MADREFKILITGDSSGLQSQSKQGAESLGEVTKATQKGTEANEEHHKSFLHVGNGAKEFHKVLHALTEESPLFGLAFRAAMSPIGGAFLAAAYAIQVFKHAEEESLKAAKENADDAAQALDNMKESMAAAAEEIRKNNQEFSSWLKNLDSSTSKIKDSLTEELQLMQEQVDAQTALLDKQKELELAKNESAVRAGEITKEQGIVNEAEIERRFSHKQSDLKIGFLQDQFKAKSKAQLETSAQMMELGADIDRLKAGINDTTSANLIKVLPNRIKRLEEDLSKSEKALSPLLDKQDKAQLDYDRALKIGTSENQNTARERLAEITDQVQRETHIRDATKASLERNRKALVDLTSDQDQWTSSLERARKQYADLNQQYQTLSREVESLRIKLSVQGPASSQAQSIADQTAGEKTFSKLTQTDLGKMLFADGGGPVDAAYDIVHGKGVKKGGQEDLMLNQLLKFLGLTANDPRIGQVILLLSDAHNSIKAQQDAIEMLRARFEELKTRATRTLPGSS